jgi:hypothetical protein
MANDFTVEAYGPKGINDGCEVLGRVATLKAARKLVAKALGLQRLGRSGRILKKDVAAYIPARGHCLEHYARFTGPYRKVDKSGFLIFGPLPKPAQQPSTHPEPTPDGKVLVDRTVWDALLKVVGQVEGRLQGIEHKLNTSAFTAPQSLAVAQATTTPEKPKRKLLGRHKHDGTFFGKIDAALLGAVERNPGIIRTHLIEAARTEVDGCSSTLLFARLKGLISQRRIIATEVNTPSRPIFKHHLPHQLGKGHAPPNGTATP